MGLLGSGPSGAEPFSVAASVKHPQHRILNEMLYEERSARLNRWRQIQLVDWYDDKECVLEKEVADKLILQAAESKS